MRKERINLAERFNWKWVMMVIMAFVLSLPVYSGSVVKTKI